MSTPQPDAAYEALERIKQNDPELAAEMLRALKEEEEKGEAREMPHGALESLPRRSRLDLRPAPLVSPWGALETVVRKVGRPVLLVQDDDYLATDKQLEVTGSGIWKQRLFTEEARKNLMAAIPAVGRVDLENNSDYAWVGTAWLVDDDIAVTNWHVATEFAKRSGERFVFRTGDNGQPMRARVDFRREHEREDTRAFVVKDVIFIAEDGEPDMALLKLEKTNGQQASLKPRLRLSKAVPSPKDFVVTIGYPAFDSRVLDESLITKFFGEIFDVKRLSPGQVIQLTDDLLKHDCSTLGGQSGSPVVDLNSGLVHGLHFSGVYLKENRAVPARMVADILEKVKRALPVRAATRIAETITKEPETPGDVIQQSPPLASAAITTTATASGGATMLNVTLQIPVQITLGTPTLVAGVTAATVADGGSGNGRGTNDDGSSGSDPGNVGGGNSGPAEVVAAVIQVKALLKGIRGVRQVREGFVFQDGWITQKPAVVVVLRESPDRERVQPLLAATILGVPVQVRDPGAAEFTAQDFNALEEGVRKTAYKKPKDFKLEKVTQEKMRIVCHLSPDSGWTVLQKFLAGTKKRLTMGMYDFTAPHVIKSMLDAVAAAPKSFQMVLETGEALSQGKGIKGKDWKETEVVKAFQDKLGNRFQHVAASVGTGMQFASAYHIKVIVRDSTAFWLSSGNLQSTNQYHENPSPGDTKAWFAKNLNREWNVVIKHKGLAEQYEKFLRYDFDRAAAGEAPARLPLQLEVEQLPEDEGPAKQTVEYVAPLEVNRNVTVMPLLTPDNYQQEVLELLRSAKSEILFQNQSLNLQGTDDQGKDKNGPRFAALYETLLEKQQAGVKLYIIMRGDFNPESYLERLQALGFDMDKVRLQNHCHTKGIVVDGKKVLLGSHNWTNEGALVNRDASLIFEDEEISKYYADAFWRDWKTLAKPSTGKPRRVRIVNGDDDEEAPLPENWVRVPLTDLI